MIQRKSKKAVTAVVATALILVVAVVSVIGFQSWFGSFSSKTFVNVEQNSDQTNSNSQIETLVGDTLYFKNNLEDNLSITEIKVNGNVCNISIANLSLGVESIGLENCTDNLTTNVADVVIVTENKIFNKKIFLKDVETVSVESGVVDLPNCVPVNNILHVGSGQTYSNLTQAYDSANDGDAIVIHSGTYVMSSTFQLNKNLKIFGSTGNPDDVIISINSGTGYAVHINMKGMSEPVVNPSFYHISLMRGDKTAWSGNFAIWGKSNVNNGSIIFENMRINTVPDLSSTYPITVVEANPKIIINNVNYLSSPYALICGWGTNPDATISINSLYTPGYNTKYYQNTRFNILNDSTCSNPSNCGVSQYNISNAVFPCGYWP